MSRFPVPRAARSSSSVGTTARLNASAWSSQSANVDPRSGTDVPFEVIAFKGIEHGSFGVTTGSYTANYQPDATPPMVASRSPAAGATGVQPTTSVRMTFSEALDASSVSSSTIELRSAGGTLVPATI